jgi:large subunit ribosomal protein L5
MSLKKTYQKEILPELKKTLGYTNNLMVPKVTKVTLNVGFGKFNKDKEHVEGVEKTLTKISGQKAVYTKAKKSISAFKVREGQTVGAMVTLRGDRMYDFIDKLVNIYFPRIKDFRGISTSAVDRQGNLNIGFKENLSFAEIKEEDNIPPHGLEVNITTNAKSKEEGLELFKLMGFPFKK